MFDERPKRASDRWYQHGLSDEVTRCVKVVRAQLKREMPSYAGDQDYVIGMLFVAHELLGETWQHVNSAGVKERSYRLAEAMADISQVLIDLTGRPEEDISGKWEIERRKSRLRQRP